MDKDLKDLEEIRKEISEKQSSIESLRKSEKEVGGRIRQKISEGETIWNRAEDYLYFATERAPSREAIEDVNRILNVAQGTFVLKRQVTESNTRRLNSRYSLNPEKYDLSFGVISSSPSIDYSKPNIVIPVEKRFNYNEMEGGWTTDSKKIACHSLYHMYPFGLPPSHRPEEVAFGEDAHSLMRESSQGDSIIKMHKYASLLIQEGISMPQYVMDLHEMYERIPARYK